MGFKYSQAGITLVETLIYIAFLSLLMGSLLGITFQTLASTEQINHKITIQQEANFILRKIDWALSGSDSVNTPNIGGSGSVLSVNKFVPNPANPIVFSFDQSSLSLAVGGTTDILNSSNIEISNLVFSRTQTGTQPEKITVDFNVNCIQCTENQLQHFTLTRYLRK